jgi:hypothetical protein
VVLEWTWTYAERSLARVRILSLLMSDAIHNSGAATNQLVFGHPGELGVQLK